MSNIRQKNKGLSAEASSNSKIIRKRPALMRLFNALVHIGKLLVSAFKAFKSVSSFVSIKKLSSIKLFDNFLVVNITIHNSPDNR